MVSKWLAGDFILTVSSARTATHTLTTGGFKFIIQLSTRGLAMHTDEGRLALL